MNKVPTTINLAKVRFLIIELESEIKESENDIYSKTELNALKLIESTVSEYEAANHIHLPPSELLLSLDSVLEKRHSLKTEVEVRTRGEIEKILTIFSAIKLLLFHSPIICSYGNE